MTNLPFGLRRSLVELMGGSIQVESTPGKGSRFSFFLALEAAEGRTEKVQAGLVIGKLTAAHPILVVDDNAINRKVTAAMLHSVGLSCELACDGLEAVEKCLSREFSAVLMDCQMPQMDGFEATRRIRAARRSALPVIAITAAAARSDRKQAIEAGMDDFLSKPVHRAALAEVLSRWLNRPESASVGRPDEVPGQQSIT